MCCLYPCEKFKRSDFHFLLHKFLELLLGYGLYLVKSQRQLKISYVHLHLRHPVSSNRIVNLSIKHVSKQGISWFPYVLSVAVVLFAFSTMISWSYYGERCAIWLFGPSASIPYKIVFLIFVFLGSVLNLGNVLGFSDLMILGMAFPNILGLLLLSGKVRRGLDEYWQKLETGAFDKNEQKSDGA